MTRDLPVTRPTLRALLIADDVDTVPDCRFGIFRGYGLRFRPHRVEDEKFPGRRYKREFEPVRINGRAECGLGTFHRSRAHDQAQMALCADVNRRGGIEQAHLSTTNAACRISVSSADDSAN